MAQLQVENVEGKGITTLLRKAKADISERLTPMPTEWLGHVEFRTVAEFRKFYTKTSPTSWPKIHLHANLKPWSFEEWNKITDRIFKVMKDLGYVGEIHLITVSKPPEQTYMSFMAALRSSSQPNSRLLSDRVTDVEDAAKADNEEYETAVEEYKRTAVKPTQITEDIWRANPYIMVQIGVKGHQKDIRYLWLYLIKENPHHISLEFYSGYPNGVKVQQNKLMVDEFCKASLRYRLSGS